MRRIIFSIFVFLFLFIPHLVSADEGWVINKFDSNINIEKSGEVAISETIDVDFNTLSKHGIYRDIPYVYEKDGNKTYTEIAVKNVLQNGHKVTYKVSLIDGYTRIKIGDSKRTISGTNSYEIDYIALGVLRSFSDHDELYWNVTGNNWPVGITKTEAIVVLPNDGINKVACFQGYSGSGAECRASIDPGPISNSIGSRDPDLKKVATFNTFDALRESQGMTVAISYKKGLIPILKVEKPKTFWEKFIDWPSVYTLGILIILGLGTVLYFWNKNGRDYWFGSGVFGKKSNVGSAKPMGAHETTVVEFTPPENLRPAEIGVLMDEKADTLDVVSTIIDLATRGYLIITEIDKKWLFGKTDYSLKKLNKPGAELLSYEKLLLDKLFLGGSTVTISSLKNTFYDDLRKVKDSLYEEVVAKNLFPSNPEKVREKYLGGAILMMFFGGFALGFSISNDLVFLADLCVGLLFVGFILLIFSRFMPRRTAYGRDIYRRIKGYRMFINKAETHRQKFFEKKNLFNEVLPYAIVFGLTGKFASAMKDMGINNPQTGWYIGTHPFVMTNFESSMSSFSNSLSSAIASTPSSSGGFSGGGSSGGGFGGGGGGSW